MEEGGLDLHLTKTRQTSVSGCKSTARVTPQYPSLWSPGREEGDMDKEGISTRSWSKVVPSCGFLLWFTV
jgi:hypothetical protein